jgi:hypothetical protein
MSGASMISSLSNNWCREHQSIDLDAHEPSPKFCTFWKSRNTL